MKAVTFSGANMFESIIRAPDFIVVKSGHRESLGHNFLAEADVSVETNANQNGLEIYVTADQTEIELIRLRWKLKRPLNGRFLGDAWERGYGDMKWEGMIPHRAMPWYFLVPHGDETAGYGVKVRPSALCFWQADPKGISL